jgi:prepilin-type N-terminal cleavage/methylation domain-containing protein
MRRNGYSLIELIVVLILISLSAALVTPSLSRFSRTIELKATAKKVSGILRYCRSEAINKGMVYQVIFNPELREVEVQSIDLDEEKKEGDKKEISQKAYSLPKGIEMKQINLVSPQYPSDLPTVEFYPNGGSNGGSFLLISQELKGYKIKVDFLTGVVKAERIEA